MKSLVWQPMTGTPEEKSNFFKIGSKFVFYINNNICYEINAIARPN